MNTQQAKRQLLQAGSASVLVKLSNVGLGFALAVVLARLLGAEGFGQYAFVYAIVSILQTPTKLGLPILIVRETARADQEGRTGLMRALWRWAHLVVLGMALAVLALTFLVIHFFGSGIATAEAFFWAMALIPMIALANVRGAALRGLGRVILGQLPEAVLRPLFLLGLLGTAVLIFRQDLTAETALMLHVVAAALAFCIGAYFLFRHAPQANGKEAIALQHRAWLVSAGILGATGSINVINANLDLVVLGLLRSEAEVGIYRVATTAAGLVVFGLQAINLVLMPRVSRLHAAGDTAALQDLATSSARWILAVGVLVAAGLFLFGRPVIELVFGEAFETAYPALMILVVAKLLGVSFGSVAMLLSMSGHERDTLAGVAVACGGNVILNLLLIPPFGIVGAAVATGTTFLLWNILLWRRVEKRLGINSMAISLRRA